MGSQSVFSDTSVLFDFVLENDDGSAKELLSTHPSTNVVSRTVVREFNKVRERREKILKSIYDADDLNNWEPPGSVKMSSNDNKWCAKLMAELDRMKSRRQIERRLSAEERRFNRGSDLLFANPSGWIDSVWTGKVTANVLSYLSFITNRNDKRIVGDAATWANGAKESFVTSDRDDLLSQKSDIETSLSMCRDCGELDMMTAKAFLS